MTLIFVLSLSDTFPHVTVGSSVGTIIFIALLAWLIYLCCRKKAPEGFTQFNNENGGKPHRRHWGWRNRRFWRRNRRRNYDQNNPDLRQTTNVIVQPVVVAIPSHDENPGASAPNMPPAPPAYDESMKNPPLSSQFMNPPMTINFNNPPMQGNFSNLPMQGNYNNTPMQGNYNNTSIQGNYNNSPMPSNFNNPPMQGNFNNPPMPNNAYNVPSKNPNASSYYNKY